MDSGLEYNSRKIKTRLLELRKAFGHRFSIDALRKSGEIEFLKQLAKEDMSNDICETYLKHKDEFDLRYGITNPDQFKAFIILRSVYFAEDQKTI